MSISRRGFLKRAAGAAAAIGGVTALDYASESRQASAAGEGKQLKKAVVFSMIPEETSLEARFALARRAGFDGVEVAPVSDDQQIVAMRSAAENTGVEIHSIIYGGWGSPLSSPELDVADRGEREVTAALRCAKQLGAGAVLLVPAIVNETTRYIEAYERSQKRIRRLIPEAEKQGVQILVENVWNNFLLSPLEFARYIDELDSPWARAYFDVGNVVAFGWPEDWIRTLGPRIGKVHVKDFKRGSREWVNLRDGDVNWPEVRKALAEVGYTGYLTAELGGGGEDYLRDVASRMDEIIAGR